MKIRAPQEIWEIALGELQIEVSKANFNTWFKKTTGLSFEDSAFVIGVPNTFIAEYLEKNQRSLIERVLTNIVHSEVSLEFRVTNGTHQLLKAPTPLPLFNPRYTFDTFIVGNSNNLAYAAATRVAAQPGQNYNPLYIHGHSGLGKTHLLHAIGNRVINNNYNALCVSAEQYTNELVTAIREKNTEEFRRKYRTVDVLLIDDIQFFNGKEQMEENFFHTFNELHSNNHQIVISGDRPPHALESFKERLRSRLEWGLVTDLQAPDFETRINLLKAKALRDGIELPDNVLEFLALQIKENIRVLEGSLNRVTAYSKLMRAVITPDLAARAIDDIACKQPRMTPTTPALIAETVASTFQITISDIKGRHRDENTVIARQIAMYLMREETDSSLTDIGKELGGRSPSTISYACEKMTNFLNNDPYLRRKVFDIRQKLHASQNG